MGKTFVLFSLFGFFINLFVSQDSPDPKSQFSCKTINFKNSFDLCYQECTAFYSKSLPNHKNLCADCCYKLVTANSSLPTNVNILKPKDNTLFFLNFALGPNLLVSIVFFMVSVIICFIYRIKFKKPTTMLNLRYMNGQDGQSNSENPRINSYLCIYKII